MTNAVKGYKDYLKYQMKQAEDEFMAAKEDVIRKLEQMSIKAAPNSEMMNALGIECIMEAAAKYRKYRQAEVDYEMLSAGLE